MTSDSCGLKLAAVNFVEQLLQMTISFCRFKQRLQRVRMF